MSDYSIDNIQHLETREAMRTRIGVYLGTDDTEGIYQALKEIVNNATDEALAGFGKKVTINVDEKTNQVEVIDEGRGVPWGIKDGRNILVAIYTESHTGGKFDKRGYKNSSGLNGIGGTAVCMSSNFFEVNSCRDGKIATAIFEKGMLKDYTEKDPKDGVQGTRVKFIPDKEVFKNMTEGYSYSKICDEIQNIAYLNKGISFIINNLNTNESKTFCSKNGIADFITDKVKKPLMSKPIIVTTHDETDEIEVAFMWTNDSTQFYTFVNGLACPEGGSPITAAKRTFTTYMKKLSGKEFDAELIRKGLVFAVNCRVTEPSFANQTKSKINNPSLGTLTNEAIKSGLDSFAATSEFKSIVEMMIKIQKAEKAADKAREAVLNHNKEVEKESKKKSVMASKLKDCQIHDENSILYIAEGDSALGSFTASRDSTYVAAMPIRGKIINALKNPIEDVLENEEVKDIAKVCGCGILDKVNLNKLRYGKIAFAADADPDGYAIVCLLLVLFYKIMPELIINGKIYWAQFPLYEVTIKKGEVMFAYTDDELTEIIRKYPKAHYDRNKGLGEMDSEAFAEAAFGSDARLVQFAMNDVEAAANILEILLGKKNAERTDYIFNNVDFSVVEGE